MTSGIPQLVSKSAAKVIQEFCSGSVLRSGREYTFKPEKIPDGFELLAFLVGTDRPIILARLKYSPTLGQWTLHRPRPEGRWSYVPEAGGSLDLNKLLRYLKDDPLNIFWG